MKRKNKSTKPCRVAISLDLDWGDKSLLEMYAGCQRYADEAGWDCSINPAAEHAFKSGASIAPYDGILARTTKTLAAATEQAGIPLVNLWMHTPVKGLPSVFPDYKASGTLAGEHLLGRGFRQFGFLGGMRQLDCNQQLEGFSETLHREGLSCSSHRFAQSKINGRALGWEEFVTKLGNWIDSWQRPIGIFVSHDLYCRFLIDICRSKGLHVSQDIAIVGVSNDASICSTPDPTLTSVDMGYERVGYRAAAMLDRLMHGEPAPDEPELQPPVALIPRKSTDVYTSEDPLVAHVLRVIAERGHEAIKVDDVATVVGAPRRTLERRFRESAGLSIAEAVAQQRVERVKRRLIETDASLKAVAEGTGFRNDDHLCKVFTRVAGISPNRYRKENRQEFLK
jgi:LacI family transcriptional regulator